MRYKVEATFIMGAKCKLKDCPPGHFTVDGLLCFKNEYSTGTGNCEAFNEAGEYLHLDDGEDALVIPLEIIKED